MYESAEVIQRCGSHQALPTRIIPHHRAHPDEQCRWGLRGDQRGSMSE